MPKKSQEEIEKDEQQILKELKRDSNQSVDSLANRCGFSRQKVWRIKNRLEEENDVWGYTAIADDEKLDVKSFVLLIKRTVVPPSKEVMEKVIDRTLEAEAQDLGVMLESSLFTHGAYDWIVCFSAPGKIQALKFCDLLTEEYRGYIADMQLLEGLVWIRKQGMLNPYREKLKDFLK